MLDNSTPPSTLLPLSDLVVLDLSRVLSGPYCSMYLGDFGARVIKIERPASPGQPDAEGGDDTRAFGPPFCGGESTYYLSVNRNKESVAVDMKTPAGQALIHELAGRADILLENFRPGVLDRLGLSYAALRERNPRLIFCSISGFGTDAGSVSPQNPWTARPGYDVVIQGMGGFASLTGEPGQQPFKAGISIADLVAGMNALCGILVALHARHRTGHGQHVDVSMLDGQVALLTYHAGMYLNAGKEPGRMGNRHPSIVPYETYATADGYINVAAANEGLWRALCQVIERLAHSGSPASGSAPSASAHATPGVAATVPLPDPPLQNDPRFAKNALRVEHREALAALLGPIFAARPSEQWLTALEAAGIPCGPILNVKQVLEHPQVQARQMVVPVPHPALEERGGPAEVRVTGVPIKLSQTPGAVRSPPPLLGQHTAQVLGEVLGLSAERLAELQRDGVVAAR